MKKAELKNSEIVTEIAFANSELESKRTELSNLELKANDLEQQKEIIDTKIAEAQAKAQVEAEAQAKAQAQNNQSSPNKNNTEGSN